MEAKSDKESSIFPKMVRNEADAAHRPSSLDGANPGVGSNLIKLYTDLPAAGNSITVRPDGTVHSDIKQDKIFAVRRRMVNGDYIVAVGMRDTHNPSKIHYWVTKGDIETGESNNGGLFISTSETWQSVGFMKANIADNDKESVRTLGSVVDDVKYGLLAASKVGEKKQSPAAEGVESKHVAEEYLMDLRRKGEILGLKNTQDELLHSFHNRSLTAEDLASSVIDIFGRMPSKRVVSDKHGYTQDTRMISSDAELALRNIGIDNETERRYKRQFSHIYSEAHINGAFSIALGMNQNGEMVPMGKVLSDDGAEFNPQIHDLISRYVSIIKENSASDMPDVDVVVGKELAKYQKLYRDDKSILTADKSGFISLDKLMEDSMEPSSSSLLLSRFFVAEWKTLGYRNVTELKPRQLSLHTKIQTNVADHEKLLNDRMNTAAGKVSAAFAQDHGVKPEHIEARKGMLFNIVRAYAGESIAGLGDKDPRAFEKSTARDFHVYTYGGKTLITYGAETGRKYLDEFQQFFGTTTPKHSDYEANRKTYDELAFSVANSGDRVAFLTPTGIRQDDIEVFSRVAQQYMNNPHTKIPAEKYGFSMWFYDKRQQSQEKETKQSEQFAKAWEELQKELDVQIGAYDKEGNATNEIAGKRFQYQKLFGTAFNKLFGSPLTTSTKDALADLGEFSIMGEDYEGKMVNAAYTFSRVDGQLYKIEGGKYVVPVPATISDESPYLTVVKSIQRALNGQKLDGKTLTFTHNLDPKLRQAVEDWAGETMTAVGNLRNEKELAPYLGAVAAYGNMLESMTKLNVLGEHQYKDTDATGQPVTWVNPFETHDSRSDYRLKGDAYYQHLRKAKESWQKVREYLSAKARFDLLGTEGILKTLPQASFEQVNAFRQQLHKTMDDRLKDIQKDADYWKEAQRAYDAMVLSTPEMKKTLRHLDRLVAAYDAEEEPGFFNNVVTDFAKVIDSAFTSFAKAIEVTADAVFNVPKMITNMGLAAQDSFYLAVKTFFSTFFSNFVDRHFDDPKLKWMREASKQAMGGFSMKHLSEDDMRSIGKMVGHDKQEKTYDAHVKEMVLKSKFKVRNFPQHKVGGKVAPLVDRAFGQPELEVPNEGKARDERRRDAVLIRYDVNHEAAKQLGLNTHSAIGDPRELHDWWMNAPIGAANVPLALIPDSFTAVVGGKNYMRGEGIYDRINQTINRDFHKHVYLSDSGTSLFIRLHLSDLGLEAKDIYPKIRHTSPEEKKFGRAAERLRADLDDGEFNPT